MKISLVGLANCGKTSIYSIAFAEKTISDCRNLSPTILYEVHKHPFLGLQLAIFDFGGQEAHRKEYLEDSYLFNNTSILIPVVDLHEPTQFHTAKQYFEAILDVFRKSNEKPKIFLFFHKFDIEDYDRNLLESNIEDAKGIFFNLFKGYDFNFAFTSIFDQLKLTKIFRDILIDSFFRLKSHIEKAENQLKEIKAKIIITDISGNIITHNFSGISSGLILRADLRYFMDTCNKIRENIFLSDSIEIIGRNNGGKELELHIFKYILSVFIMKSGPLDVDSQQKLATLLTDMNFFADLIISSI